MSDPDGSDTPSRQSNAYELFILVLTVLSLAIMVALTLPLNDATTKLLQVYDNVICVLFLFDFSLRLKRAPSRSGYFFEGRGWLDLIGSVPSLGFFKYTALLRLARLSRLARIARLLRGQNRREIVADIVRNRGEYAFFVTVTLAMLVLSITSVLVLQFEADATDASITSGGAALWWAIVTITTVGYGDLYPVTAAGKITGVFVMIAGVGIIGALASILASVLIPQPETPAVDTAVSEELAAIRAELAAIRATSPGSGPSA